MLIIKIYNDENRLKQKKYVCIYMNEELIGKNLKLKIISF